MALMKSTATTIMSAIPISASATAASSSYDVSDAIYASLEIFMDYSTDPTSGNVSIYVYASDDGTNWSDDAFSAFTVTPDTDRRTVFGIEVVPYKYIKVDVTNDTDQSFDCTINASKVTL